MRLIIENGTLLTLGRPCRVLEGQQLLIEGDRITRIAPRAGLEDGRPVDRVVDATGKVVMPGLVNAHMHFYSTLVRGLGKAAPSADFLEVLSHLWWRLDRTLSLDDVEVSAEVALLDAVRRGTTTVIDHHASPGAVTGSLDRIAAAVKRTGLRACLCYEVSDRDGDEVRDAGLEENAAFLRRCVQDPDPQLRAMFGLHAAFTLSDESLVRAAALAGGAGCHVHVAEAASDVADNRARYGAGPVERLAAHGLLGPRTIAAHAVHVDAADRELLASTGTFVVHNPQSNLNNAVGIADVMALAAAGVPVGLGTDAMTLGMLEELRVGLWAQHLRQHNPSVGFQELTDTLAVHNPSFASALWGFPLGTLTEGAAADVILLDYQPPTPLTDDTALGHLVFGLSQVPVDTTIAGGRVLMEGGRLAPELDEVGVAARARELAGRLWDRF